MKNAKEFIKDSFYLNDIMYVVLDNSIDPKSGNKLLLGKFIFGEFTEVKPLSEEEYEEVSEYYLTLVSAIYVEGAEVGDE